MKRPKRLAALLLAGFFMFAPPGTIIFSLVVAAGLIRHYVYPGAAAAVVPVEPTPALPTPTPEQTQTPTPSPVPRHIPAATPLRSRK